MPPVKNIITTAPPAFPAICLLRQPGLDGADPRTPLLPASHHPPASSPVTAFKPPQLPQPPRPASTGFDLNSSLLDKHGRPGLSERPHRGGGPVNPQQPAPAASHTYLPLGFCLHCDAVSPEGLGLFFPEVAEETPRALSVS